ncbi:hypothetical protein AQJ67_37775 [Streptomyces caeruleatus]|uniref:Uncharacterized protein n=1 Tax=Streptomyces caeruleatus TaxID=661399 RepID=A0A101TKQ1_9ACTN|nr:hypothetical protein AQJ67_37775 [Streptomyces caeruleatus]
MLGAGVLLLFQRHLRQSLTRCVLIGGVAPGKLQFFLQPGFVCLTFFEKLGFVDCACGHLYGVCRRSVQCQLAQSRSQQGVTRRAYFGQLTLQRVDALPPPSFGGVDGVLGLRALGMSRPLQLVDGATLKA